MIDDTDKPVCVFCALGFHDKCLWATRPTSCGCLCPWLVAQNKGEP